MTDEIIEAPKTDFYLKLASEADLPTALAAFYKQDMEYPIITPSETVWSYDMTAEEYAAYMAALEADEAADGDGDVWPEAYVTVPDGVIVTSFKPNDAGTLTLFQATPAVRGEEKVPVGDPYLVMHTADYAIDLVGVIMKATGNTLTDAEGFEYPEMAPLDGYHVNIRIMGDGRRADVEALSAYFVDPEPVTPARVWL